MTTLNNKRATLLFYKVDRSTTHSQLIDTSCYILVILGLIGNILGLFIFTTSRRTWRISSTYVCLATSSSITNLLCTNDMLLFYIQDYEIFSMILLEKCGGCVKFMNFHFH